MPCTKLVLPAGIEPATPPIPRESSTVEPQQRGQTRAFARVQWNGARSQIRTGVGFPPRDLQSRVFDRSTMRAMSLHRSGRCTAASVQPLPRGRGGRGSVARPVGPGTAIRRPQRKRRRWRLSVVRGLRPSPVELCIQILLAPSKLIRAHHKRTQTSHALVVDPAGTAPASDTSFSFRYCGRSRVQPFLV